MIKKILLVYLLITMFLPVSVKVKAATEPKYLLVWEWGNSFRLEKGRDGKWIVKYYLEVLKVRDWEKEHPRDYRVVDLVVCTFTNKYYTDEDWLNWRMGKFELPEGFYDIDNWDVEIHSRIPIRISPPGMSGTITYYRPYYYVGIFETFDWRPDNKGNYLLPVLVDKPHWYVYTVRVKGTLPRKFDKWIEIEPEEFYFNP